MQARTTTIAATLVTMACALALSPAAALADERGDHGAATPASARALEVRNELDRVNEQARRTAPPAVGNRCEDTVQVEGIGDTCVSPDGLLRVEQSDGRSHTIHGMDAPPTAAASLAPSSQAAINGASAADVTCAPAGQPQYVLVYARPGNVASRYSTIAPQLRTEAYKASAFIDSESRAVAPAAGKRLPMRCEAGTPVVLQATLGGLSSGTASFGQIVDAMRAQGYQFNGDGNGLERYIIYYDAPSPTGAAGTGHVFTSDASASAGNQNNKGGLYAVEYRFDGGGGVPHWEVLIHEVIHTMGAVVNAASHSTAAGHCTDGQDVMCYQDSATSGYSAGRCGTRLLDCGRDDYFNPAPASGSFLATHWNTAATYNRWLDHRSAVDGSSPTPVTGLVQAGASNSTIGVAWNASSDDSGEPAYVVSVRSPGGAWRDVTTTTRRTATVPGLAAGTSYEVGVLARDAAGNATARAVIGAATSHDADSTPPARPSGVSVRQASGRVTFSWNESGDNVGVSHYELRRIVVSRTGTSRRVLRAAAGRTTETSITIRTRGLRPGVRYQYEVVARDDASNVSPAARAVVKILRDRVRPTTPARLRAKARARTSITTTWNASRDNVAVTSYRVYQRVGRRWVLLKTTPARSRTLRVVRLRPATTYTFKVHALDRAGNASKAGRVLRARTR